MSHQPTTPLIRLLTLFFCLLAIPALAQPGNHVSFVVGPINSGPEATKQCLECHEQHADDFMKTSHWSWTLTQEVDGKTVERGKKNAFNNFCVSIAGNEPRCTSCHAGYGWKDNSFDFADKSAVDCLVCHDTTGTYTKDSTGAGHPSKNVDLLRVAQNVGKPTRDNCGSCHFYGGGGDAVKHGDLDSSMAYPERSLDVHMATDGNNFVCQDCHTTQNHAISGNSMGVSPGGTDHFGCQQCHDPAPHKESRLNRHTAAVACQTCHIPFYAKEVPTKLAWDWSTAGEDRPGEHLDQYGMHSYMKSKGDFVWGKNVVPEYAWYNGAGGAYTRGEKIDPKAVTRLAYPLGDLKDETAKIYPFKVMRGKQIYDSQSNILMTPKTYGEGGYWKDFDWNKAAALGAKAAGLDYSGEYGFAPTIMYWRLNHMVAPKEQALGCLDCHGDQGRMSWQELGYPGDPMVNPQWARQR